MKGSGNLAGSNWNQTFHFVDLDVIHPGDIILTRSPGERTSDVISLATASNVSHAILVVEPPYALESADVGVVKFRLDRFAARSPENIRVLRIQGGLSNEQSNSLCESADRHVAKKYNTFGALMSIVPFWRSQALDQLFCSQLVAAVFSDIGEPLTDDASTCTPGDLLRSSKLVEVPNATKAATAKELGFIPTLFDASNPVSPQEALTAAMQQVTAQTEHIITAQGKPRPTHFFALIKTLFILADEGCTDIGMVDSAVAEVISSSGMSVVARKYFLPTEPSFFYDLEIYRAIKLGILNNLEDIPNILEFIARSERQLVGFQATLDERREDIRLSSEVYALVGLQSIKLFLAGMYEAYIFQERSVASLRQAILHLRAHLKTLEEMPQEKAS